GEVRVATEQHRFPHALREQVVLALRQDADHARQVAARPTTRRPLEDLDRARGRLHHAERRAHQRRLATAVGPEHGVERARARLERDAPERVVRGALVAARHAAQGEDQLAVHRRNRKPNTGAPKYCAGSSPRARRSSGRAAATRMPSGSGAYTRITSTVVHDAPENPPHSHRNALRSSVACASETMAVVIAAANAPTATPPSSS